MKKSLLVMAIIGLVLCGNLFATEYIYVATDKDYQIHKINMNNKSSQVMATHSLYHLRGLAVKSDEEYVYTASYSNPGPNDGAYLSQFDQLGNETYIAEPSDGLQGSRGLGIDHNDNLYVTNTNDTVTKVAQDGTKSTHLSGFTATPHGVAVATNGKSYVTFSGSILGIYNSSGTQINTISNLSSLRLAFGPDNYLYANINNTITKIDINDNSTSIFANNVIYADLDFDAAGNLYTIEGTEIYKYNTQAQKSLFTTGIPNTNGYAFLDISGTPDPIPEPVSIILLALSIIGLIRRKK